jgi:endogenous inhibitor of DNA gyrase (YacG/DUF329 family)
MPEFACPRCPSCGQPPLFIVEGSTRAYCGNFRCQIITWDLMVSPEENLADEGDGDD